MEQFINIGVKRVLPGILINKTLFFGVYKISGNNECVVDVAYTVSHLVAGGIYAYYAGLSNNANMLKLLALSIWTLRLSGFLFINRILKGWHDPRYEAIFHKYKKDTLRRDVAVFGQYFFQGLIVFVTSSTLYFLFNSKANTATYLFLGSAVASTILEGVADQQLENYKNSKQKTSQIFEQGLWTKSRHPNLFFDLATWVSFACAAYNKPSDLFAFVGPSVLYMVMNYLTIPITERLMKKKRGELFDKYSARTNKFLPI